MWFRSISVRASLFCSSTKLTHTGEISPPAFRASFGGLAYQLGNMASSAAAQIEATAGESLKLKGTNIPDYVSIPPLYFILERADDRRQSKRSLLERLLRGCCL